MLNKWFRTVRQRCDSSRAVHRACLCQPPCSPVASSFIGPAPPPCSAPSKPRHTSPTPTKSRFTLVITIARSCYSVLRCIYVLTCCILPQATHGLVQLRRHAAHLVQVGFQEVGLELCHLCARACVRVCVCAAARVQCQKVNSRRGLHGSSTNHYTLSPPPPHHAVPLHPPRLIRPPA